MKKFLFTAAVCLLIGVALFLFYKSHQSAPPAGNLAAEDPSTNATPASTIARPPGVIPQPAETTGANHASPTASASAEPRDLSARAGQYVPPTNAADLNLPPETVLQNVRRAVRQYGQMFGGNPVGTNPEITAALTGQNPKKINFIAGVDGMRVNDQGELIDLWGTPYFFHQISGEEMEIHSAGPDKKMWTSDDIVTR